MSTSSCDRYVAFLAAELPALAGKALRSTFWRRRTRTEVLDAALAEVDRRGQPGIGVEFGVHRGASLRRSAERLPGRRFYGFDSFEGFPNDGRTDWQQDFSVSAFPEVPANAELVPGWFSDTLPSFLETHADPIAFINIDCDIYSSTNDVFRGLEAAGRLHPGQVIYFDELINYNGYLWNEMLGLFEMLERTGFGVEWLAVHDRVCTIEETVAMYETRTYPRWEEMIERGYRQQVALVLTSSPTVARPSDRALVAAVEAITRQRFAGSQSPPW